MEKNFIEKFKINNNLNKIFLYLKFKLKFKTQLYYK